MTEDTPHRARCLTLWANHYLHRQQKRTVITDLFYDLRSGEILLDLLLILFHCDCAKDSGQLNIGKLNNISSALALLQKERVSVDGDLVTAGRVLIRSVRKSSCGRMKKRGQQLRAASVTPCASWQTSWGSNFTPTTSK